MTNQNAFVSNIQKINFKKILTNENKMILSSNYTI